MLKNRKRLLLIAKILYEETDERNPISFAEMMDRLDLYGCKADRKPVYNDIKAVGETLFPVRYIPRKGYYAEREGYRHADRKRDQDSD